MKITGILKALAISFVLVGSVSFSSDVRASLTPVLQPGSPTGVAPGPFTFTYDVSLASDQKLNAGGAPPASVTVNIGTLGNTFTSFFTVYDFAGLVAGSNTQPAGWGFQDLLLGSTPTGTAGTTPLDQVTVSNLTWYWTGEDAQGNPVPVPAPGDIGDFAADSSIGNLFVLHNFTSAATLNTPSQPATNNTAISTIGTVVAPGPSAPPGQVPEPATLLLLGTGLAGLAGWRKWSAKKN